MKSCKEIAEQITRATKLRIDRRPKWQQAPVLCLISVGSDNRWYSSWLARDCKEVGIIPVQVNLLSCVPQENLEWRIQEANKYATCIGLLGSTAETADQARRVDMARARNLIEPSKRLGALAPQPYKSYAVTAIMLWLRVNFRLSGKRALIAVKSMEPMQRRGSELHKLVSALYSLNIRVEAHLYTDLQSETARRGVGNVDLVILNADEPGWFDASVCKPECIIVDAGMSTSGTTPDGSARIRGDLKAGTAAHVAAVASMDTGLMALYHAVLLEKVAEHGT